MHVGKQSNCQAFKDVVCILHTYVFAIRLALFVIEVAILIKYLQMRRRIAMTTAEKIIIAIAAVDLALLLLTSLLWVYDCMLTSITASTWVVGNPVY